MDFYTINEVAEKLKVTRAAVYKWMAAGQLGYVVVGKHRRVTSEALNAFIRSGGNQAGGDQDSSYNPEHMPKARSAVLLTS